MRRYMPEVPQPLPSPLGHQIGAAFSLVREIVTPDASTMPSALGFSTDTVMWGTKSKQHLARSDAKASSVSNVETSTFWEWIQWFI